MRRITDRQMERYWSGRVTDLESLRPITQSEAAIIASEQRKIATAISAEIAAHRADAARYGARLAPMPFGLENRRLMATLRAEAYERVADQPVGDALDASLREARQRAGYYAGLIGGAA